jgi:hypothetical protein
MTKLGSHWTNKNLLQQNHVKSTKSVVSMLTEQEVLSDFVSSGFWFTGYAVG